MKRVIVSAPRPETKLYEAHKLHMIRVQVRPNETLETALRRFKRQCNYAGIFRLAKKYSNHEKRSDQRRREERERIKAIQRAARKAQGPKRSRPMRRSKVRAGESGETSEASESTATSQTATNSPAAEAPAQPATAEAVRGALTGQPSVPAKTDGAEVQA